MAVSNQVSVIITGTATQLVSACQSAVNSLNSLQSSVNNGGTTAQSAASGGYTMLKNILANLATDAIKMATNSIGDFASSVITTGAQFDSAMSQVAAISGATGDELLRLRDKAKEMGGTTKFTASESAEAFTYMAMAGWKTEDMLDGISGIMNLAAASGSDLATTSDIVTDALSAFGLTAKDSGRFADVLAAASANANTNVEMMGATFKYAAPVAGALGYTIEDTAVAIGLMANAGIKADQAGTSLRSIMQRLASDTGGAATAARELGVDITNADGSMRPLSEVVVGLRKAFSNLSEEEKVNVAKTIAGTEAMSGLLAIVGASDDDFYKLTDAVNNSSGAAEQMADTMIDNAEGGMTLFDSKLEGIKIQIWEGLEPAIRDGIDALSGLLDVFQWMLNHGNEIIGVVAGISTGILAYKASAAIIQGLQSGYSLLEIAQLAVIGVQEKLAVVQGVLNAVMSMNPIAAIIGLLAALVVGFISLWNTSEDFRNFWIGVWEAIQSIVGVVCEAIGEFFGNMFNGIGEGLEGLGNFFNEVFSNIGQFCQGIFQAIADFCASIFEGLKAGIEGVGSFFNTVLTNIGNFFSTIFTNIWNFYHGIFQAIADFANTVFNWLKNGIESVGNFFNSILTHIGNFFNTIFTNIWNFVNSVFTNIRNFVDSVFEAIKNALKVVGDFFNTIFTNIGNFVNNIFTNIRDFISSVFEAVKNALQNMGDFFNNVFTNIGNFVNTVFTNIRNFIDSVFEAIKNALQVVGNFFNSVWTNVGNIVTNIFNGIKNTIQGTWNFLTSLFGGVAGFFGNVFGNAWNAIRNVFSGVGGFFSGVWNTIVSIFTGVGAAVGNAVSGAFRGVVNGVLGFVENFVNTPIGILNGFIGAINGAFGWLGVNLGSISTISLPRMETGGIVPGSSYSGDYNVIRANSGEMILTRAQQGRLFDAIENGELGGSKNSFNIEVNVDARGNSNVNVRELSTSIAKELKRAFENQGLAPDLRNAGALR